MSEIWSEYDPTKPIIHFGSPTKRRVNADDDTAHWADPESGWEAYVYGRNTRQKDRPAGA